MKIKDIALSAAYVGQRVVKAIAVGAQEIWSAVKYIIFADPVVEQICATNWGDGVGITEEQAAAVTDIGTIFEGNTEIETFNELNKFSSLSAIGSATTWDKYSFANCTNLREVSIPSQTTILGNAAFQFCPSLKKVNIPRDNHITRIGSSTFQQCSNLVIEDLYVPYLAQIGTNIFNGVQLKKISNLGSVPAVSAQNTFGSVVEEVVLPPTCKKLGNGVFRGCKNLRSINLEYVEIFENFVFIDCVALEIDLDLSGRKKLGGLNVFDSSGIKSVYAPDLEEAEQGTFSACKNLSGEVSFPKLKGTIPLIWMSGTNISKILDLGEVTVVCPSTTNTNGSFQGCKNLTYVNLPSTVTQIGGAAFMGCSALEEIICNAVTPPTLTESAFWATNSTFVIYVPDQSVTAYREASGWLSYADRIKPLSQYVEQ